MSEVYVVSNQHGFFASKQKEWLDGREPRRLFRSTHKDEAINMVFESSSKDISIRAEAILVELDKNKHPIVEVTVPVQDDPDQQEALLMEETTPATETTDGEEAEQQTA